MLITTIKAAWKIRTLFMTDDEPVDGEETPTIQEVVKERRNKTAWLASLWGDAESAVLTVQHVGVAWRRSGASRRIMAGNLFYPSLIQFLDRLDYKLEPGQRNALRELCYKLVGLVYDILRIIHGDKLPRRAK